MLWYSLLIAAIAVERVVELVVSKRNWAWSRERGGFELGAGHYPAMVVLHLGLLMGCVLEPVLADRPFIPALGWPMLAVAIAAQGLRWWCITTLGQQWNIRVVVIPGAPRVAGGPYRMIRHPNYVAVVVEGIALPLVHSAWFTALVFTVCNAALLRTRIKVENSALAGLAWQAAEAAGVKLVHGELSEVTQDAESVCAAGFRARYLAAADGLRSPIWKSLGLSQPCAGPRRWGIRRHVQVAPWTDSVEVHWAPGAEAYVTPIADDCVGIAILSSERGGFDRHFEAFDELRDRVHGHPHGQDRAAGPLRQKARSRAAGRVLLVGDAAGYIDALTGEGMGLAFGAADLLVDCVIHDRPGEYDRRWRQMTRRYRALTAALLHASAHAPLRAGIVPAAQTLPFLFNRLVNLLAR